ncbi:MAG: TolC family protein [Chitinophagaceae bacterium]
MRVKITALCVMVLFMIKSNAQQESGGTLSLRQSIETGIANNLQVRLRDLDMQRANVNYRQSKGNMIPTLSANVLHGINQGRSINPFTNAYINQQLNIANYSISSDVTIFNGFRLLNSLKQTSLAYDASKMELEQARYELTLDIILAYLQILNNEDQLVQSRNQAALSRKQVERLEVLNKDGAIAPALLYEIRGQLANDELAIVNTQNALNVSKVTLAQLMNVPLDPNIQVERLNAEQFSMTYEGDAATIYQAAIRELAAVKAVDLRKQSAEKGVKVAKGALAPTVYFGADLSTNYSSAGRRELILNSFNDTTKSFVTVNGNSFSVITPRNNVAEEKIGYMDQIKNNYGTFLGIGIRIPILNSLRARNQVSLAKIDLKSAEYTAQTTYIQLKQAIDQAFLNMKTAEERYRILTAQVEAFNAAFRAAEVRFNAGLGTSVDYQIARNNLDRANINLVNARYDYVLRTKILDYYQNKPLW